MVAAPCALPPLSKSKKKKNALPAFDRAKKLNCHRHWNSQARGQGRARADTTRSFSPPSRPYPYGMAAHTTPMACKKKMRPHTAKVHPLGVMGVKYMSLVARLREPAATLTMTRAMKEASRPARARRMGPTSNWARGRGGEGERREEEGGGGREA